MTKYTVRTVRSGNRAFKREVMCAVETHDLGLAERVAREMRSGCLDGEWVELVLPAGQVEEVV